MRRDVVDARGIGIRLQDQPEALSRQAPASVIQEERIRLGGRQRLSPACEVILDCPRGLRADRDDTCSPRLALACDLVVFQVDVLHVQGNQFADSHACRIEQRQHRPVTNPLRLVRIGCHRLLQQPRDLVVADGSRNVLFHPRRCQLGPGFLSDDALLAEPGRERLERRRLPGDRRGGIIPLTQVDQVPLEMVVAQVLPRGDGHELLLGWRIGQPGHELLQIISVGGRGIGRKLPFVLQGGQERGDLFLHRAAFLSGPGRSRRGPGDQATASVRTDASGT